jgi:hypothetical protein
MTMSPDYKWRLVDPKPRRMFNVMKGQRMNKIMDKLVASLVAILLPRVLEQLVKAVEEIARIDLNKDGTVGFGDKDNG